jgi:hypothetical protein
VSGEQCGPWAAGRARASRVGTGDWCRVDSGGPTCRCDGVFTPLLVMVRALIAMG